MTLLTVFSVVVAALAAGAAWRVWRRERERSAARVAALAATIDPPGAEPAVLFSPARPQPHDHPLLKIAAGFVIVVTLILVIALIADRRAPAAAADEPPGGPSLALLSMRHEREGATLTVIGLVRNQGRAAADGIVATVLVFDRTGTFLTSARAPLDERRLDPGADSPFRVAIPRAGEAARYSVSFRNDGGAVRHLDRRASLQSRTVDAYLGRPRGGLVAPQ